MMVCITALFTAVALNGGGKGTECCKKFLFAPESTRTGM